MEVKNVFLQGDLEEQVYMVQTPQISVRSEQIDCMLIEEVPIRTQASPTCLEHEDHADTALDGVFSL